MIVLVCIMLVIVAIPTIQSYVKRAERMGCVQAFDSARRRISEEYIVQGGNITAERAKEYITQAMLGWEDLCPAGGEVYLVKTGTAVPFDVVCGLHNENVAQRTRLNANTVLQRVKEAVKNAQDEGIEYPESVTVKLNGKDLVCQLVDADTDIRWGTGATSGYEGTVAFYALKGHSDFGSDTHVKNGEICYFCFADEAHCANWNTKKGWTGDSYDGFHGTDLYE